MENDVSNAAGHADAGRSVIDLPDSPDAFAHSSWEEVLPYYEALATVALEKDDAAVERWLSTWSRLDTLVGEAGTLAMIAYTGNTADSAAESAYLRFSMEIFPKLEELSSKAFKLD